MIIKNYKFQNIQFVHDFIYIFLIGVFTMILLYFSLALLKINIFTIILSIINIKKRKERKETK